jgi:hypothetical protein
MQLPPLSLEALIGLFAGFFLGLVEMNWELRSLGVLLTAALAIHIAKRLDVGLLRKIGFAACAIALLVLGTYHPIWVSFHEDFPTVTGETALSRIIEFFSLAVSGIAAYIFLIRPRGKKDYRVLPAQLIAFGAVVMTAGLIPIPVAIGLGWQFQQNWAAGIKPSGAPVFTLVPPQITQTTGPLALPPPQQQAPQTQFFSLPDYNLTEAGVTALADELYKIRDALGHRIELDRMSTEGTAAGFISNFGRACDRAGVECPVGTFHPNAPDEKGLMIYVVDPNKPPTSAQELQATLLKLGIDVPFVARAGFDPLRFALFVGPKP